MGQLVRRVRELQQRRRAVLPRRHGRDLRRHDRDGTSDPETFTRLSGKFDLIINTVIANIDLNALSARLAVNGTLVGVGAPPEPSPVNGMALAGGRRSYAGSMIGGIAQTQEMLDLCGEHDLAADIELISADQVNEAYDRVIASAVRYRFVIDTATL
jgi:uncharacterized zinc-type alcohol dehydrogenase-like protein